MSTLYVTFYSYKGGVGRTLALLNVAALLAESGRRVVAIDFDLEAPGFGLSELTHKPGRGPLLGVSDLLMSWLARNERPLEKFAYTIRPDTCGDRLHLMPAGQRCQELAHQLPQLFRDTSEHSDAGIFHRLLGEVAAHFEADYILMDSRTGLADIAAISTIELSEVLVAVAGLSEQNISGMASVLEQARNHPNRPQELDGDGEWKVVPQLQLLVLSPVPHSVKIGEQTYSIERAAAESIGGFAAMEPSKSGNPILERLSIAQQELLTPVRKHWQEKTRVRFPRISKDEIYHVLPLDPAVPVLGELHIERQDDELSKRYLRLARALVRAHPDDDSRDLDMQITGGRPSWLVPKDQP